jgi:hypothetical protein
MQQPPDLVAAAKALEAFAGTKLTARIASLEAAFNGTDVGEAQERLTEASISEELLTAASVLKRAAGQIHVIIHAVGILLCLPHLLNSGERVESLSLGAGNTGRDFDLETSLRVAEFKFINWQGGPETIRQNALFKDLYLLAEHPTPKKKCLYVLDTTYPLKFLQGGRALDSVMSRNRKLWAGFQAKYGTKFSTVGEYYAAKGGQVSLVAIGPLVEQLVPSALFN